MIGLLRGSGAFVIFWVRNTGAVTLWLMTTLRYLLRGDFDARETLRQAYHLGNRSFVFASVTMCFIGMIMVLQACYQAQQLVADYSLVGPSFLQLLVREFAPTIGALLITTRVGAGISAEVASMKVTEQIDAFLLCAADPIRELIVPRVLASAIVLPALIVLSGAAAELAGLVAARVAFSVPTDVFLNTRLLEPGDAIVGFTKMVCFGWVIPLIAVRSGLEARGGSAGVGTATTRAVVEASLAVIFIDLLINLLLFPLYSRG